MTIDSLAEPATSEQIEALAREVADGERGLHQLSGDARTAAAVRRRAMELRAEKNGAALSLEHMGQFSFDAQRAATQHCENFAGVAQVPVGLVGPVRVRGEHEDAEVVVPMATTEGALLASVNRGCRAIQASGGVRTRIEDIGMTRAPAFRTNGLEQVEQLLQWVRDHEARIRSHAEQTSRFLSLEEIRPKVIGTTVFLRFRFLTGDAMGMNMATIACDRIVSELIEPETGVECVALSGNYCVDKKPSAVNFELGRGKRIFAEVELSREVLQRVLKTRSELLTEVQLRKNLHGSIAAGAMGYNAQFANTVAAFFLATGQDIAHVVEGSMGLTHFEQRPDGAVYASVYLPDAPVAAVGGGTGLDTQREALDLLGIRADVEHPGRAAQRLAEILGAIVLAGELSLMSAFTSRDLARAHERLGRAAPSANSAS